MGVSAGSVSPFFISIDPKRDTPKQLTEYSKQWDPRIQWLTGTDAEMAQVAKDFRIYFSATSTDSEEDEDYLLDHSTFFYLMDREGKFAEVFSPYNSPEEIAIKMHGIIQAEQGQAKKR